MGKGQPLPVNNEQVLNWKYKSKNQFKDRGHISGVLTKVYKDKTGHRHFQVRIGEEPRDTIEVIYNQSFGRIQEKVMQIGAIVEACGDYITSNKRAGGYQASPDGAVLHWVHKSTNPRHDSGYVAIEGELYGYSGKESHDLEAVY
ncbi:hypothetical protein D3C87_103020 [compost metagenome]